MNGMRNNSTWLILLMVAPAASITAASITLADTLSQSGTVDGSAAPLSVAPLDHVEYPDHRPSWLDRTVDVDDDSASIVVVSGPCDTVDESLEELKLMQRAAVETYISRISGGELTGENFPISDEEIENELVVRRYEGDVYQGDSTRYEHAVELHFDADHREAILAARDNLEVRNRLGALGVLTFGGLMTLIGSSALLGFALRRTK